ncbi:hypothetical protein [Salmonella enterica]|nr:hypothetical protein [Salmonella enterica]MCT7184661.1 hypothetical protein [Salmonella enterica subsp. enterica serovar Pomona]
MSERKYLTQNEVSAIVSAASQRKYAERAHNAYNQKEYTTECLNVNT